MMFARVLVPLDGSELSEQVLAHAAELAERYGARATLLLAFEGLDHLAQVFATRDGEIDRATWEQMHRSTDAAIAAAREYLELQAGPFKDRGVAVDTIIVDARNSTAARTILDEAATDNSVIVMSTHGRGGLRRALFGSTAQKVLESSPVPVLLVRSLDEKRKTG